MNLKAMILFLVITTRSNYGISLFNHHTINISMLQKKRLRIPTIFYVLVVRCILLRL